MDKREENESVVRRLYAAVEEGDADEIGAIMAEDLVWRVPGRSRFAGVYRGREEYFRFVTRIREHLGDTLRNELVEIFPGDSGAVVLQHSTGSRGQRDLDSLDLLLMRVAGDQITEVQEFSADDYDFDEFVS